MLAYLVQLPEVVQRPEIDDIVPKVGETAHHTTSREQELLIGIDVSCVIGRGFLLGIQRHDFFAQVNGDIEAVLIAPDRIQRGILPQ